MNNWDDLKFLVALSKTGTMTAAARMLGTNTATVSRRIERLSETLGKPAFVKTADGWQPSEAVSSLIQLAQAFDGQLQSTLNSQAAGSASEMMTISLGCPPVVRSKILVPGLIEHHHMLDGVRLNFTDRVLREGLGENDLVIALSKPDQGRVVTRKAGELRFDIYGFRDEEQTGDWAGLNEAYDSHPVIERCGCHFKRPPRLRVDSIMALYGIMKATRMPGPLPDIVAQGDPNLIKIAPDETTYVSECWLYFHESRRSDPGMRRAVDWIIHCFQNAECASGLQSRAS